MKLVDVRDMASFGLDANVLYKDVHVWTERRKGTARRYSFARVGRRKIYLGGERGAARAFKEAIAERRIAALGRNTTIPRIEKEILKEATEELRRRKLGAIAGKPGRGHPPSPLARLDDEASWRAEFRGFHRPLLEERTWPGITEDQWVALRRAILSETKRRARLGLTTASDQRFADPHPMTAADASTSPKAGGVNDGRGASGAMVCDGMQ